MDDFSKELNDSWLDGMHDVEGMYDNETAERKYDEVPDGNYQVQVHSVSLGKAKTSGNTMLKWQLRIIAPTSIGRLLFKNHVFTAECIRYVKQDLGLLGFDHSKFRQLPDYLNDFLDLQIEVAKKTSQPARDGRAAQYSVYFNRLIGRGEPDAGSTEGRLNSF